MRSKKKTNNCVYRIDILRLAKLRMIFRKDSGLCCAIRASLRAYGLQPSPIRRFIPEHCYKTAEEKFGASHKYGVFWWEMGFGLFSNRRKYMNWLIETYKDDKTNLRGL